MHDRNNNSNNFGSKHNNNKRKWQEKEVAQQRPGDWACMKCGVNNWANRDKCFKCKKSKIEKEPRKDWICELCLAFNLPNRFSCFRCQLYKKDEEWEQKRKNQDIKPLFVHPSCIPYTEDIAQGDVSLFHPASFHSRCAFLRPPPKPVFTPPKDPIAEIYATAFLSGLAADTKSPSSSPSSQHNASSNWPRFPSVVERYYTELFYVGNRCEQYIHKHSNGLCLVGLASGHPALSPEKKIVQVNWKVGNSDRSLIEVSGRKKKGALWLDAHSLLCELTCDDGSVYTVQTGVHGKLIEVNPRLPAILTPSTAEGDGWLAILLLKKVDMEGLESKLLTKQGYQIYRQNLLQGLAEHEAEQATAHENQQGTKVTQEDKQTTANQQIATSMEDEQLNL